MKLTDVQQRAVDKITSFYFDQSRGEKKEIQFIAPTGSGKTFMIANVISDILKQKQGAKIVFVIFTISDAELPKQFKNKLEQYQDYLDIKYNVEHKESPSASNIKSDDDCYIKWKNHDVLIFGTQSFGEKRIYTMFQRFHDAINEMKQTGHEIIYIRDEAHRGEKKESGSSSKSEQAYVEANASLVIKMTATPNANSNAKQVVISEKELNDTNENTFLLKDDQHMNIGFKESEIDNDDVVLNTAINKFKEIKMKYFDESEKINFKINPAMLIQVNSKNQYGDEISDQDKRIDEITKILDNNNLSWIIYFGNRKESSLKDSQNKKDINLNTISKNNSSIDVVIFKVGPATGWDIPRACMLVQLRKVSSTKLNEQTIGRIKRNPDPTLKNNELFRQYWIYSQFQPKSREIHKYKLRNKFEKVEIRSIRAIDKEIKVNRNNDYLNFVSKSLNPFLNDVEKGFINLLKEELFLSDQDIIIKEDKWASDTNEISVKMQEKLSNLIEMKKYVINQKSKYKNWIKFIEPDINNFFIKIRDSIRNNYELFYLQFEVFFYRELMEKINNLRKEFFAKRGKYLIEKNKVYLPKEFIIYEAEKKEVNFEKISKIYGYQYVIFEDEGQEKNIQYLDSEPEQIFFKHVQKLIIENEAIDKIEIFTKNPALFGSPVYFEYWNNEKAQYAKAYVDFIIKFKNRKITFYIEVKSKENDYDEMKTNSIGQAFEEYKNIKDIDETMILLIALVDKNNKLSPIEYKDVSILKPGELNENLSFDDLFKAISEYK